MKFTPYFDQSERRNCMYIFNEGHGDVIFKVHSMVLFCRVSTVCIHYLTVSLINQSQKQRTAGTVR